MQHMTDDKGHRFPLAVPCLTKGRYVDDIYRGAETEDELKAIIPQLIGLCTVGGFPLSKWISHCPKILGELGLPSATSSTTIHFDEEVVKVLGLFWNPHTDTSQYKHKPSSTAVIRKRTVLLEIARIYDPLGLVAPVIIRAKIFIQELWLLKIGWDDPLPLPLVKR